MDLVPAVRRGAVARPAPGTKDRGTGVFNIGRYAFTSSRKTAVYFEYVQNGSYDIKVLMI
jgi:hypothetical protein